MRAEEQRSRGAEVKRCGGAEVQRRIYNYWVKWK